MSRHIKVNDQYFVIETDKSNMIKFRPISTEEAVNVEFEKIVLDPAESIKVSIFQEAIDKAQERLKTELENGLRGTVLRSLGFEHDQWSKAWKVDHCNGRMSAVTDLLAKELKDKMLKINLATDFELDEKLVKNLKSEMKKEFETAYRQKLRNVVYGQAEKMAVAHVDEMMKELTENKLKEIAEAMIQKTLHKIGDV